MNPVTCSSPQRSSLASTCTQPIRRHVVQYKLVFLFCPLLCCLYFYITRVSVLHVARSPLLSIKVPSHLSIQLLELL